MSAAPAPEMKQVSRRAATLVNLVVQNTGLALTIVRGIVVVPIYLHFVERVHADLYDAWLASGNIISWIAFSEGGLSYLLRQQTAQFYGRGDRPQLAEVIGSGLAMTAALAVVAAALGLALSPFVPGWFSLGGPEGRQLVGAFACAVGAMALGMVVGALRSVQQGFQRHGLIGGACLFNEAVSIVMSVVWLWQGWGVLAIGASFLLREVLNLAVAAGLVGSALRQLHVRPAATARTARSLLAMTGWTFLNYVAEWGNRSCDAFFVAMLLGNAAVTPVVMTLRAWEMLSGLLARAAFAFQPGLAHVFGAGEAEKFKRFSRKLLAVMALGVGLGVGCGVALNRPFVTLWVGAEYFVGDAYNLWWSAAQATSIVVTVGGYVLVAAANIRGSAVAQLVPNATRVALLPLLLALLGPQAVPISIAASFLLGGPLLLREWRRTFGASASETIADFAIILRAWAVSLLIGLAWRWLPEAASWMMLVLHAAALAGLLCVVLALVETRLRELVFSGLSVVASRLGARTASTNAG